MFDRFMTTAEQSELSSLINRDTMSCYVMCKMFNKIITSVVSDAISQRGFSANWVLFINTAVYLSLVCYQDSAKTSGMACLLEETLNLSGGDKWQSYAAGFAANVAVSLRPTVTPVSFVYTAVTTGLSLTTKFCTQKVYDEAKSKLRSVRDGLASISAYSFTSR